MEVQNFKVLIIKENKVTQDYIINDCGSKFEAPALLKEKWFQYSFDRGLAAESMLEGYRHPAIQHAEINGKDYLIYRVSSSWKKDWNSCKNVHGLFFYDLSSKRIADFLDKGLLLISFENS